MATDQGSQDAAAAPAAAPSGGTQRRDRPFTPRNNKSRFEGDIADLKGHVFTANSPPGQFQSTLEAFAIHAASTEPDVSLATLFDDEPSMPTVDGPGDNPKGTGTDGAVTERDKARFTEAVKEEIKAEQKLSLALRSIFMKIIGQSDAMTRVHLQSQSDFTKQRDSGNCLWAINHIEALTSNFDLEHWPADSAASALTRLHAFHQGNRDTAEYYKQFRALLRSCTRNGLFPLPTEVPANAKALGLEGTDDAETTKNVLEAQHAALLIINSCKHRFHKLKSSLRESSANGRHEWPLTVDAAHRKLQFYESLLSKEELDDIRRRQSGNRNSDGDSRARVRGGQCTMCSNTLSPKAQLIDSGASYSLVSTASPCASGLADAPYILDLDTQGGPFSADLHCRYSGLPGVPLRPHAHPDAIGNVLALRDVAAHCRVTMDTAEEHAMYVHVPDGPPLRFAEFENGLCICDNTTSVPVTPYFLLQTVSGNRAQFTRRQLQGADAARDLSRKLGRPQDKLLEHAITHGHIQNAPVTPDDMRRADFICGKDTAFLKGHHKNQGAASPHVRLHLPSTVPPFVLEHHSNVVLCIDFFFVQRIPFFHCISRHIGYRHTARVSNRTKDTMLETFLPMMDQHDHRGLSVRAVHADAEFGCIEQEILPVRLDLAAPNGHVPEVERSIQTMKEDLRTLIHGLPFRRLPAVFVEHAVGFVNENNNSFPRPSNPLLKHCSPNDIVTGGPKPDCNNIPFEFGSCAQAHDTTTNTQRSRTLGSIVLQRTGHANNSYHMLSLATGRVFTQVPRNIDILPITDIAIARLEKLAELEGQPLIQDSNLLVEWRPNQLFDEDEHDKDFVPEPEPETIAEPILDDFEPVDADEPRDLLDDLPEAQQGPDRLPVQRGENEERTGNEERAGDAEREGDEERNNQDNGAENEERDEEGSISEPGESNTADAEGEGQPPANSEDNADFGTNPDEPETSQPESTPTEPPVSDRLRPRRNVAPRRLIEEMDPSAKSHGASLVMVGRKKKKNRRRRRRNQTNERERDGNARPPTGAPEDPTNPSEGTPANREALQKLTKALTGLFLTQMSARAGIKKHGEEAREALRKEHRQMVDKQVYSAMRAEDLTPEQKEKALRIINVIKEKRSGALKGRQCADGRPQREWCDKSETSSPTVSADSLFLSLMIDAYEGRDVATADIAGAYLNAIMEDFVIVRLTGEDTRLMCEVCPDFREHVTKEKGRDVLCLKLDRALCGCVQSALLWYKMFVGTLQDLGFVLNPCDPCVANAMIDGKQCTILWHVDDTKISHVDAKVVDWVLTELESKFGTLTKTRGKAHEFLGIKFEIREDRSVELDMRRYLEEAVRDCGLDIRREAATPATKDLFDVDPDSPSLVESEADTFRSVVMKVFCVGLRSRPDLLVALSFLCARVQAPTHEDQRKLRRMLEHANGTLDLVMKLRADSLDQMFTFIDVACGVHSDFKSQTGGCISLGTGSIVNRSTKQKLNVKSSTEGELVGASEHLPNATWVQHFMAEQGYPIRHSFLEQDNESAIKLIKNGRASAGRRSRHINIRHFWIKDRLGSDGFTLRHCVTEAMLSDFLSKPLQGSLFRKFRDVLLGYAHISSLCDGLPQASGPEERVGDHGQSDLDRTDAQTGSARATKTCADVARASVRFAAPNATKPNQPSSEIV